MRATNEKSCVLVKLAEIKEWKKCKATYERNHMNIDGYKNDYNYE